MKFCPKRSHCYKGINGVETSADYVLYDDVIDFHGKEFADQWFYFIKNRPMIIIEGGITGFYYADYKEHAIKTDMYINSN